LAETDPRPRRSDRSAWYWLLLPAIILPLLTFLYNKDKPRLAGFPLFYWLQLAFVILGVVFTVIVYVMTRTSGTKED
jgi:uncharacterized membrane protein YhdT